MWIVAAFEDKNCGIVTSMLGKQREQFYKVQKQHAGFFRGVAALILILALVPFFWIYAGTADMLAIVATVAVFTVSYIFTVPFTVTTFGHALRYVLVLTALTVPFSIVYLQGTSSLGFAIGLTILFVTLFVSAIILSIIGIFTIRKARSTFPSQQRSEVSLGSVSQPGRSQRGGLGMIIFVHSALLVAWALLVLHFFPF